MNNYTFGPNETQITCVKRGGLVIPFDMGNRDCAQFLKDWEAGAEVLNADGSPATYSDDAVRALGLEP